MGWNELLDQIKQRYPISSERQLADFLMISPATLGHIRANLRPPSGALCIKILDKTGYALTRDIFLSLLPLKAQVTILKCEMSFIASKLNDQLITYAPNDHLNMRDLISKGVIENKNKVSWGAALDELKLFKKIPTESKLSQLIDISPRALNQARKDIDKLPCSSKILTLFEFRIPLEKDILLSVLPPRIYSEVETTNLNINNLSFMLGPTKNIN